VVCKIGQGGSKVGQEEGEATGDKEEDKLDEKGDSAVCGSDVRVGDNVGRDMVEFEV